MPTATPGRPRATPGRPGADPRLEILDAAAALFAERGYAATSTRQIAERAGLRQASLYYHVSGKEEILLELLRASVMPTLERAASFAAGPDPVAALYSLALDDVATLLAEPHNIGTMYLAPEVAGEALASFRAARAELASVYGRLAHRIDSRNDPGFLGASCMQQVELVIVLRRDGTVPDDVGPRIGAACLRLAGVPEADIARVASDAQA